VSWGCYTIWDDETGRFIYAGMAGKSLTPQKFQAALANPRKVCGLKDRLGAHRTGNCSGDQFSIYILYRFVMPSYTPADIAEVEAGRRRPDDDVNAYIQTHLSYRWVETNSEAEAHALEKVLRTQGLNGEPPYLNPL
jgi:hypothetical protein